jgi:hypothetical protein
METDEPAVIAQERKYRHAGLEIPGSPSIDGVGGRAAALVVKLGSRL